MHVKNNSYRFINSVFLIGMFIFGQHCASCVEIKIEAETMFGNYDAISDRSSASGGKSVHLLPGQSLHTDICLLTPAEISGVEVFYSNDGGEDRIRISVGTIVVGEIDTLRYTNNGYGWDQYKTSTETFKPITVVGRKSLKLTVIQTDKYGVEIDFIKFNLNVSQSVESLECETFCFDYINYSYDGDQTESRGRAEQMSVNTSCAEEDNVNIPIFHDNPQKFVVTAHMPKYSSFANNRGPDWANCAFSSAFWSFSDIRVISGHTMNSGNARLVMSSNVGLILGTRRIAAIEVDFVLGNLSSGSTESVVGTQTIFQGLKFTGSLSFQFQYYDRYDKWSDMENKIVKQGDTSVEFETADNSFREGSGNKIRVEIFSDRESVDEVIIGEISMHMRKLTPDKSTTLYKDDTTVIEGVRMDLWWRINETMAVTILNRTFGDVHYIRVYRRGPWTASAFSQIFVLYQDGNVRLLPLTPHGLDWIPFGSSVIIGQTDPSSPRPSAAINHLDIDPIRLKVTVFYKDGGVIPIQVLPTLAETKLIVSDGHFAGDLQIQPFFTFRSMYVTYGNSDVDHISVGGNKPFPILDGWSYLSGNFFAFFRQCISKHNTQSPDITISVLS